MITDAALAFVNIGAPLSLVAAAGVAIPSGIVDMLGVGVGVAPPSIIGNVSLFGQPAAMGVGARPELVVNMGIAAASANAATLKVQFQAAADLGVGGGYQPGPWQTLAETDQLTVAQLAALTEIARFPYLPPFPENLRPRYLRLNFAVLAATNFTAGSIQNALPTLMRDDYFAKNAAKNFTA